MNASLASRSPSIDHLAQRLLPALTGMEPETAQRCARELAHAIADLDHKLRIEVDEALGRLETRIETELRDLAQEEQ
jgi:flagellar motility protein MotE (MotC chaperone)